MPQDPARGDVHPPNRWSLADVLDAYLEVQDVMRALAYAA